MPNGAARDQDQPAPSPWVVRFLDGVAAGGSVLDVACGGGRHLRLALECGHAVTGVDRDLGGVADLEGREGVSLLAADLERGGPFPLAGRRFAGVVVTNYLWRPILGDIVAAVADDGVLVYETFVLGQERFGRPANPDFLLRPNELLETVLPDLVVVAFEHGMIDGERPRVVQRIAACGRAHRWATDAALPLAGGG